LNRADAATLRGLFGQFATENRADAVVAALKQSPVRRLSELTLLPGVDDSLALAVAPYVTVWSDGFVNINSAPEPVLAALPVVGRAGARSLILRRQAGDVLTSIDVVRPGARPDLMTPGDVMAASGVPGALVSMMPSRLMLVSRGWQEGHPLTHEIKVDYAVVGQRLVVQARQERDLCAHLTSSSRCPRPRLPHPVGRRVPTWRDRSPTGCARPGSYRCRGAPRGRAAAPCGGRDPASSGESVRASASPAAPQVPARWW